MQSRELESRGYYDSGTRLFRWSNADGNPNSDTSRTNTHRTNSNSDSGWSNANWSDGYPDTNTDRSDIYTNTHSCGPCLRRLSGRIDCRGNMSI